MADEDLKLEGAVVTTQDSSLPTETQYYFDVVTDHTITLQSQITDNWLENNTAVQDHIAHNPMTITLSGFRGELVHRYDEQEAEQLLQEARLYTLKYNRTQFVGFDFNNLPFSNGWGDTANVISEKLTTIGLLIPGSGNITQLAKNVYDYSKASYNRYKTIVEKLFGLTSNGEQDSLLSNVQPPDETRVQEVFNKLKAIRYNNEPMTVSTPYGDFYGMYIQSLTLRQDNQNFITDIELTLKELRFASVEVTDPDPNVMSTYNAAAAAQQQNNGMAQSNNSAMYDKFTPYSPYENK